MTTQEQNHIITKITEEIKSFLTSREYGKEIISIVKDLVNLPEYHAGKFHTEYMTTKEAADLLGITITTINNWSNQGHITAYKFGGSNRYRREDITRLFNVQPRTPKVSKAPPLYPYSKTATK